MRKIGLVTTMMVLFVLAFAAVSAFAFDFGFYEGELSIKSVDVVVFPTLIMSFTERFLHPESS